MLNEKKFEVNSIPGTLKRLHAEGYLISEGALRTWIKAKKIPARFNGQRAYLYYPNVLQFLKSGESTVLESTNGIRRIY